MKRKVTLKRLQEVLSYDAVTGTFLWLVSTGPRAVVGSRAGSAGSEGYRTLMVDKVLYKEHVLAWFFSHKRWPVKHIDHIDRDTGNNALSNLRLVTRSQNLQNTKLSVSNTSGCRGVSWRHKDRKWSARISLGGQRIFLGEFKDREDAVKAYTAASKRLHTHRPLEITQ